MANKIKYVLDPYRVMKLHKRCLLNPSKSKTDGLELGMVWKFINGGDNLNGAHDSLVDVKAQTDIVIHPKFVPFFDRKESIQDIADIFANNVQNAWKKKMESVRPVHSPWTEQTAEKNIQWEPRPVDCYTGAQGGPRAGPSQRMKTISRSAASLVPFFFAILPWYFFEMVSNVSHKYCHID